MNYKFVASLVAAVCVVLFALFMFAPQLYAPTYGVTADTGAVFMTRRASPMFLALAWILWASRDAPRSALRDSVSFGGALSFAAVAATGVFEWATGVASSAILVAAVSEVGLAALLVYTAKLPA